MERDNATKPVSEKHPTKAFANWVIKAPATGDIVLKGSKGFPLQQHPDYPNKQEDALIALAEKHGGNVRVLMEVDVRINKSNEPVDLDAIPLFGEAEG